MERASLTGTLEPRRCARPRFRVLAVRLGAGTVGGGRLPWRRRRGHVRVPLREILRSRVIHQIAQLLTKLPGFIGQGAQLGIDAVLAAMKCRLGHPDCAPRGYRTRRQGRSGSLQAVTVPSRRPDESSTLLSSRGRSRPRSGRFLGLNGLCQLSRCPRELERAVQPLGHRDFLVELRAEPLQVPDAIGVFHDGDLRNMRAQYETPLVYGARVKCFYPPCLRASLGLRNPPHRCRRLKNNLLTEW